MSFCDRFNFQMFFINVRDQTIMFRNGWMPICPVLVACILLVEVKFNLLPPPLSPSDMADNLLLEVRIWKWKLSLKNYKLTKISFVSPI